MAENYTKSKLTNFQLGNINVPRNNKLCSLQNSSVYKSEYIADCLFITDLSVYLAPRPSGQTSIFGVVFFVSKSLLGIERQKKLENLQF